MSLPHVPFNFATESGRGFRVEFAMPDVEDRFRGTCFYQSDASWALLLCRQIGGSEIAEKGNVDDVGIVTITG